MEIEFDASKADANRKKHGVSFEEAASALLDGSALSIEDLDVEGESRWILIGMSEIARLLTVVYTYRPQRIRLISARRASKNEVRQYAQRI